MPSEIAQFRPVAGRLSDGRSAGARSVNVSFGAVGLEIAGSDDPIPAVWPYATLGCGTPLTRKSVDVLLNCKHALDATLFISSPEFVQEVARRAPQLTTTAVRWRWLKPMLAVSSVIALLVGAAFLFDFSPARWAARALPDDAREALGRQVVQSMSNNRRRCNSPDGLKALDALTDRIAASSGLTDRFKVIVVDWSLLNAFAAPGEQIVLTRELIEKAETPEEVAGVLAHEMGHGIERHPESGIIRALGFMAAAEIMLGGGGGTIGNAGVLLAQLSYTRAAEREADDHAVRMLKAAQISQKGFVDFFRRVEKQDGGGPIGKVDILRTHPQIAERVERIAKSPAYATLPALEPWQWQALKRICRLN
jgi:predicted Zn-dependent protease